MAGEIYIGRKTNTINLGGNFFQADASNGLVASAGNGTTVTITNSATSKVIVSNAPYNKLLDLGGTAFGGSQSAVITALNNYFQSDDPDLVVTGRDTLLKLDGVEQFTTGKAGELLAVGGAKDGAIVTTGATVNSFLQPNTAISVTTINASSTIDATGAIRSQSYLSGDYIRLEGSTSNSFETTLQVVDPTQDNTITFPDATGTVALTSDIPSFVGYVDTTGTPANNQVAVFTDQDTIEGSTALIVDGANVGIGTATPYSSLHVSTPGYNTARFGSTNNAVQIRLNPASGNYASLISDTTGPFYIDANTHVFRGETGGNERMRITSGGNVGIGTTSPTANLQIGQIGTNNGNRKLIITGYDDSQIEFNNHDGWGKPTIKTSYDGTVRFVDYGFQNNTLKFEFGESATRQGAMRFWSSSNEAIKFGTNVAYPIAYIGPNEEGTNYTGGLKIKTREDLTTTHDFYFSKLGNLGIGTATPSEKLHVDGNIFATDRIYASSAGVLGGSKNFVLGNGTSTNKSKYGDSVILGLDGTWDKLRGRAIAIGHNLSIVDDQDGSSWDTIYIGHNQSHKQARGSIYLGNGVGNDTVVGANNLVVGNYSGQVGGNNQLIIGHSTASNPAGSGGGVLIGHGMLPNATSINDSVAISQLNGLTSTTNMSRSVAIGTPLAANVSSVTESVLLGYGPGKNANDLDNCVLIGSQHPGTETGANTIAIGYAAGQGNYSRRVSIGNESSSGSNGVSVGQYAGRYSTGANNTLLGSEAGRGVSGASTFSNTTAVGYQALTALTTGTANTAVGYQAADAVTTGYDNTIVGYNAADIMTAGYNNTAVGKDTLRSVTSGYSNTAIGMGSVSGGVANTGVGTFSLYNSVGIWNTALGMNAGYSVSTGNYGTFVGGRSGRYTTGENNTLVGYEAGAGVNATSTFSNTTAVGYQALTALTTGYNNTAIGYQASADQTTGALNTSVGYNAGRYVINSNNTFVGNEAGRGLGLGASAYSTTAVGSQALRLVSSGNENTALGYLAGGSILTGSRNTFLGFKTGLGATSVNETVAVGYQALTNLTTGQGNTAVGYQALQDNTTGGSNTALGYLALANAVGQTRNTAVGYGAFDEITDTDNVSYSTGLGYGVSSGGNDRVIVIGHNVSAGGSTSVSIGGSAGYQGVAIGYGAKSFRGISIGNGAGSLLQGSTDHNIFIGNESGYAGDGCRYNTFLGSFSGRQLSGGDNNVLLGYGAGYSIANGSDNIFLGYQAGYNETGSNKLYIENSNSSTPLIYGEFDNDIVRVNGELQVGDPTSTGFKLPTTDGTASQVLSTDGSGNVTWVNQSGGGGGIDTTGTIVTGAIPIFTDSDTVKGDLNFSVVGTSIVSTYDLVVQDLTVSSIVLSSTGNATISGLTSGDVEISSKGNVSVQLDSDNNETSQSFTILDPATTERFKVSDTGVVRINDSVDLAWNSTDGALDVAYDNGVTLQVGQEEHFYAKATEAIDNGDIVMFAGAQGDHLLIAKADMDAANFFPEAVIGVATQDFANNEFGYVTSFGKVRGLDTDSLNEGDLIYLDPDTPGGYVTSEPTPPDHIILVATVTRSHQNEGTIFVRPSHKPDSDEIPEGSTNLYLTSAERTKLTGIEAGAEVNVQSDWNAASGDAFILNKPDFVLDEQYEVDELKRERNIKIGSAGTTSSRIYDAVNEVIASDSSTTTGVSLLGFWDGSKMTLQGMVAVSGAISNPTAGAPLYLGTSGAMTHTAPTTSGYIARVVGHYVVQLQSGDHMVYFNPSNSWVEID